MIINEKALLSELGAIEIDDNEFKVKPSKEGGFTVLCKSGQVSVYINSKYNPVKSGEQFAKSVYTDRHMAVYGLGLGYHIKPLIEMLADGQLLYVFESSLPITKIAFEKTDILTALRKDNVVFCCTGNMSELARFMDGVFEDCELIIYEPSLKIIPSELAKLHDVLFEYKAAVQMLSSHKDMMEKNKAVNTEAGYRDGVRLFSKSFKNIPAVVVSGGASLEINAGELLKVLDKTLIVSVTRAAKTLWAAGVSPDFYVAADAGQWIRRHLDYEAMSAPLFLLQTADCDVSDYKGEKLMLYEKGSSPDREFCVEGGGSVATVAISLCAELGANPIIFIGQDLCFCFHKSHSGDIWQSELPLKGGKYVLANDGEKYYTSGSLHIFLKWIERYIARNKNIEFYNATAKGAVIEGAPNIELTEFFGRRSPVRDKILAIMKAEKIKLI